MARRLGCGLTISKEHPHCPKVRLLHGAILPGPGSGRETPQWQDAEASVGSRFEMSTRVKEAAGVGAQGAGRVRGLVCWRARVRVRERYGARVRGIPCWHAGGRQTHGPRSSQASERGRVLTWCVVCGVWCGRDGQRGWLWRPLNAASVGVGRASELYPRLALLPSFACLVLSERERG